MPEPSRTGPTTAQLKADIDSGRTGDKLAASDPAASPLGTDDEAAGTSPTPGRIATARAQEVRPAAQQATPPRRQGSMTAILVAVVVVIIAVAWFAVRR